MPSGAPWAITMKWLAGLLPNLNVRPLSDGPMPPPPFGAWQPTQLNVLKYCMPRSAEVGSFAIGLVRGSAAIPPGMLLTSGTFRYLSSIVCCGGCDGPAAGPDGSAGCWAGAGPAEPR